MKLPRRRFLHLAAGAATLPILSRGVLAQAYPTRPVRVIVPYAAGDGPDIVARLIGQWLSERLSRQFIIENRPGAGSNIGTEAAVRAAPDGYTLLYVTTASAISPSVFQRLNFNFIRDIAPVAGLIRVPNLVTTNPSLPIKTIPELIAYAKANPGKLNFGAPNGGTVQLSGELLKMMTGVNIVHVPYTNQMQAVPTRSPGKSSSVLPHVHNHRAREGRQAARPCSDDRDALASSARHPKCERFRAGLRGEFVAWDWRAQEHGRGDCREAEQGDQRGARDSDAQNADCRIGWRAAPNDTQRFRAAHRRRNREMEQGGKVCRYQSGMITCPTFYNVPFRESLTPNLPVVLADDVIE